MFMAVSNLAHRLQTACLNAFQDERKVVIDEDLSSQPWRIGTQAGDIDVSDVLLLGVIFVSDGAIMPLLAV